MPLNIATVSRVLKRGFPPTFNAVFENTTFTLRTSKNGFETSVLAYKTIAVIRVVKPIHSYLHTSSNGGCYRTIVTGRYTVHFYRAISNCTSAKSGSNLSKSVPVITLSQSFYEKIVAEMKSKYQIHVWMRTGLAFNNTVSIFQLNENY